MSRKFLVPLVLPADPTVALEAATKQYVDARVVATPGYVGPWRNTAGGTDVNTAQFGNTLGGQRKEGLHVDASGYVRIYAKAGVLAGASQIQFVELATDHVTETWIASLFKESFQVGDIWMGRHLTHNMFGLFIRSEGNDYIVMRGPDGELYLNAKAARPVYIRQGNVSALTVDANQSDFSGSVMANRTNQAGFDWNTAQFCAYMAGGNQQCRISMYAPGIAPQLRVVPSNGEKMNIVNSGASAWAPVQASAFEVVSTTTTKRDVRELGVRPLRMERERIVVHHPVDADTVPDIDLMALRPVAFRPKHHQLRIVPTGDGPISPGDNTSWRHEPEIGILGHEGTRERLGLIAEDVATIIPSAVTHTQDGDTVAIDYAQVVVALLDHVQRLTDEVATLRYRITELEGAR